VTAAPCLVLVVAHPDDETFGCGSLLLHAAARGARTVVVCATRGEAGETEPQLPVPDGDLGRLREAELRAAADLLGVAQVELLGFADSGMTGDAGPESLAGAPLDTVADAVRAAIGRHAPDVVVTLDGSDGHRDHLRLREVVETVLSGTTTPLYLQCLPRSLMQAWVRHHAADDDAAAYTSLPEIGTPDELLTTLVDTSEHLARREEAMVLHRSQRSPFDGLPDELRRAFLTREHLVRLNPPRSGGPPETELLGLR
jgi:LmbE family N-acetylglucosaminyl deacetylase